MNELLRLDIGPRVLARQRDGGPLDITGKAAALVAVVVLEGQAERRWLSLMFWPGSPEAQARHNLLTLVHRLYPQGAVALAAWSAA